MLYLIAILLLGLSSPALAQPAGCMPTPQLDTGLAMRSCQVLRQGEIGSGLTWEIQQRRYFPPRAGSGDAVLRLMVVKERGAAVAWTEPGYGTPARPERFISPRGILLRLPVAGVGGARTLDEVWLRREPTGFWARLDAQHWRDEAQSRLRPGETLPPVFRLELRPLRATGSISRPGDQPCCPSGGTYTAWLDLGEDQLVLTGFSRR